MSTQTAVETETETATCTRTAGACAIGAGAAAITCKAMVLGFLASGLALVGLSSLANPVWLMAGVLVLGSAFVWKGFRWAGRRPALLGIGALVTMWVGYVASGLFVTSQAAGGSREFLGSTNFGMFPAGDILANPMGLIPVALLYITGTVLFFGAVYDSYLREFSLDSSKGGMAAGLAGASVCGGCGVTGLAGAGMVLLTGSSATNATKFVGANSVMLVAVLGILGYTVYTRAWKQTGVAVVGLVTAFFLTSGLFGFPAEAGFLGMVGVTIPETAFGEVVDTMFSWTGLGLAFFGLVWAYYPHMEPVPPEWKERIVPARAAT
jgi:hypothetical protein